jgi:hypothetical protein
MARARKPHPADIANANVVASAVRFEIALFLGAGLTLPIPRRLSAKRAERRLACSRCTVMAGAR